MRRCFLALTLALWFAFQSSPARADPASAEALFREGRALLERGDLGRACETLEASNALEPSSGTLLNLANCRLKQGKTATAWAHFVAAARVANIQNRPQHAKEAERRRAELEPELCTLTLKAPDPPPGLELRRDGRAMVRATLGTRIPIDPGEHRIEVSAPGYALQVIEVTLGPSRDHRVVDLPKLAPVAADSPATAPARERATAASSTPSATPARDGPGALPWVIGGAGAAALITGGIFGALALSSDAEARDQCGGGTTGCSDEAVKTAERRDSQALISTVGVGVGLVGVGVATVWLLSAPSAPRRETAWRADAEVGRDGAVFAVRGRF